MKKRILSLFLSMLMIFAVLPNNVAMAAPSASELSKKITELKQKPGYKEGDTNYGNYANASQWDLR